MGDESNTEIWTIKTTIFIVVILFLMYFATLIFYMSTGTDFTIDFFGQFKVELGWVPFVGGLLDLIVNGIIGFFNLLSSFILVLTGIPLIVADIPVGVKTFMLVIHYILVIIAGYFIFKVFMLIKDKAMDLVGGGSGGGGIVGFIKALIGMG